MNLIDIIPKIALFLVFIRALPLSIGINASLLSIKYSKVQIDEIISQLSDLKYNKEINNDVSKIPFNLNEKKIRD